MSREGNQIGIGRERDVFNDQDNEGFVIKRERGEHVRPREARARFYFGKLIHLLLPENIPQVHRSNTFPPKMLMEKKLLDEDHVALNKLMLRLKEEQLPLTPEEARQIERYMGTRKADLRIRALREKLWRLGIESFDGGVVNFGYDQRGNVIYLDTFEPWYHDVLSSSSRKEGERSRITLKFDPKQLHRAILALPEPEDVLRGESYLSKVLDLFLEERAALSIEEGNHA